MSDRPELILHLIKLRCGQLRFERVGELYVTVVVQQIGFDDVTWESERHSVRRNSEVRVSDLTTLWTQPAERALILVHLWEWDGKTKERALDLVTGALKSAPVRAVLGGKLVAKGLSELVQHLSRKIRRPDLLGSAEIVLAPRNRRRVVLVSGRRGEATLNLFRRGGS